MPNSATFTCLPIGDFVRKYMDGVSIDPFARNCGWATHTNDLNPETDAQHHMTAKDFLRMLIGNYVKADVIIFDPPYSLEQAKRNYESVGRRFMMEDSQQVGRWTEEKHLSKLLLKEGGVFLHFGWHTNGIGKKHGFEIEELLVVAHGGAHNDTLCLAERKVQGQLL